MELLLRGAFRWVGVTFDLLRDHHLRGEVSDPRLRYIQLRLRWASDATTQVDSCDGDQCSEQSALLFCVSAQGPFVRGVVGQCTECPCTPTQRAVAVLLPSLVRSPTRGSGMASSLVSLYRVIPSRGRPHCLTRLCATVSSRRRYFFRPGRLLERKIR
jgi:hypothetical protein